MQVGTRIQSYVVQGEAGRGGMGIVYHARDESLDRDVAIKVLPEIVAFNPDRLARFQREAKLLASLNHPNIASIYGLLEQDKQAYVVMEFVEGESLSDRTSRGAIPWRDAVPVAIEIATAIEYAHGKGVIHRDLKPANVKFDIDGNVKVLDFGLAKAMTEEAPEAALSGSSPDMQTITQLSDPTHQTGSTTPGVLIGTIGYASPEQARGRSVDKRTDIFSFGCLLFEMLAGGPPFPAETAVDAIGKTLHKEPEWHQLPADLPPRLVLLLRRCLAKDRKDRLCDIGDARLELSELESHSDLQAADGGGLSPAGSIWPLTALVGVLAALVFAGLYFLGGGPDPARDAGATSDSIARPVLNRSLTFDQAVTPRRVSSGRNGSRVYFVTTTNEPNAMEGGPDVTRYHLCVREQHSPELRTLHTFGGLSGYAFSPDDESYVLNYGGRLFRGKVDSDIDPVELARIPDVQNFGGGGDIFPAGRGVVWFDDATLVLESIDEDGHPQLVLVDAKTGAITRTVPFQMESKALRRDGLIGRFDDDHVLMYVSLYSDEGFSVNLATVSLTTGKLSVLLDRAGDAKVHGRNLFFTRGDTIYVAEFDPETHQILDAGTPVQTGLFSLYGSHAAFELDEDGTLMYLPGGVQANQRRLMINDGSGITPTSLPDAAYDNSLSVSGDGSRICVTRSRGDGLWEVWGGTVDPPRLRRLVSANDTDFCWPMLSYDGTRLLSVRIASNPDGVRNTVMEGPFDGSRPARMVWDPQEQGQVIFSCFHPDNDRLIGHAPNQELNNGVNKLVELDLETGELSDLITRVGGANFGLYSPDGSLIAFRTMETGSPELHLYNPATGEETLVSTIPVQGYRWIDDEEVGRQLVFWDPAMTVRRIPVESEADGSISIGDPYESPFKYTGNIAFALDLKGVAYSIQDGVNDGPPGHMVVIDHWADSVTTTDATP